MDLEFLIELLHRPSLAIQLGIELVSRQAPKLAATSVVLFGNVGLNEAGISLTAIVAQ